jgi:hypothetical protein
MANVTITNLTSGSALIGTELFEAVQTGASVKLTANQIKTFASSAPTLLVETTNTNTPATAATLSHETSATASAGIGTRLAFQCETSASNNKIGALLSAVTTNVGSGTEAFDLQVLLMAGGAAGVEKVIAILTKEIESTLQLTGVTSVKEFNSDSVRLRKRD